MMPSSSKAISGSWMTLELISRPFAFQASPNHRRTIAAQNIVIKTQVALSTAPKSIVEKIGTIHSNANMDELMRDDRSPMITFSAKIARAFSCESFIDGVAKYRQARGCHSSDTTAQRSLRE